MRKSKFMFRQCVTMCWYRALKIMIAFVSSPLEDDILPREILFDYLARIETFYGHWNRLLFWFLGQFCDNKCRVCSLEIFCSYMIVVNIIFEYSCVCSNSRSAYFWMAVLFWRYQYHLYLSNYCHVILKGIVSVRWNVSASGLILIWYQDFIAIGISITYKCSKFL